MRDEKRNIQRRLKSIENTLEQKLRDASRRARKMTQLQNFLQDRENSLASSFEGELTPEFLHQKLTQIQTISDEPFLKEPIRMPSSKQSIRSFLRM